MTARPDALDAPLAFSRPEWAESDPLRRDGVLRVPSVDADAEITPDRFELVSCRVRDCDGAEGLTPSLAEHGFAHADLSRFDDLQAALARVREAGRVEDEDVRAVRRGLLGRSLPLGDGAHLRILYIAPEGFLMRRAGPNGRRLVQGRPAHSINDHVAATEVHVDQDVLGTPLRQILGGLAPLLFHHDAPTTRNRWSRLHLVNVWIPLTQVTRPLVLADGRSVNRRAHQARLGLGTNALFARKSDRRVNDIWSLLHHPDQRWYFTARMDATRAYVFQTLSAPHGACILPAEDHAEALYVALGAAIDALDRRDADGLREATGRDFGRPPPTTAPLTAALGEMSRLLREGHAAAEGLVQAGEAGPRWRAEARSAMERVVRQSLELRAVGWLHRGRAPRRLAP